MSRHLILTSSWFTPIPPDHKRVGVSRYAPRGLPAGYRMMTTLAPGNWFNKVGPDEYRRRYFDEILGKLDPAKTVDQIRSLAEGKVAVLCCFEAPPDKGGWCHRGYISAWLADTLDIVVPEMTRPDDGFGWSHPKLPEEHRLRPGAAQPGLDLGAAPRN